MVARMSDQLGRVLGGRYRLAAPIGTGASAQVFMADDETLRRRVAVKVLHPALATDEAFLGRFRDEARAAAAMSHPNLMAVYDWGEDDGPYLVLEYLGGGSLRAMLDRGGRLSPAQALVVGLEASRALDAAHRRGFVHRDIKPANLLFGEDGRLRIADFGLARALSEAGWTEPRDGLVGTVRYAAPEQAKGGRVDGKADVYALGLVLCEAVTGEVPLVRDSALETLMARVETPVPVPDELGLLKPILTRVGSPDPAERPDAAELGRALVAASHQMDRPKPLPLPGVELPEPGDDITIYPDAGYEPTSDVTVYGRNDATGVLPPVTTEGRRRRWPWALLVLLLLAGVVAGGLFVKAQLVTPSEVVPAVSGRTLAEAQELIRVADAEATDVEWQTDVRREFHDTVPVDQVIAQEPVAGEKLDDGGTVTLVVSKGPPLVDLPQGLDQADEDAARAAIEAAQLGVGAVTSRNDETVAPGIVITWSAAGTERPAQAPKGSPVDLVLSSGPAPREIPGLQGRSEAEAKAALEGVGLLAAHGEDFSDTIPAGQVIGTNPGAGKSAARGSTVTIVVSKGPNLVAVPDVGRAGSLEQAVALLESAGLEPGAVNGDARGKPFATDPGAGAKVRKGSSVDIFLRRSR